MIGDAHNHTRLTPRVKGLFSRWDDCLLQPVYDPAPIHGPSVRRDGYAGLGRRLPARRMGCGGTPRLNPVALGISVVMFVTSLALSRYVKRRERAAEAEDGK